MNQSDGPSSRVFMDAIVSNFDISLVTGYAGYRASDFLYASKNYISAINETVAVDFAHMYSYLGKRSLVIMKNAGLNQALLPIINSSMLGTNAGMVLWITDDLTAKGSEIVQDSRKLLKLIGIKPKKVRSWEELYSETRGAYIESERRHIVSVIIISDDFLDTPADFTPESLENHCSASQEIAILHPNTAMAVMGNFNRSRLVRTSMFPKLRRVSGPSEKFNSSAYQALYSTIKGLGFDVVIGDFGTYTLAQGSIVQYGLHYGSAIASGVGASIAGKNPLVLVGEGGLTSGFESILELVRKKPDLKIILIENGGISAQEDVEIDLIKILSAMGVPAERINEGEMPRLLDILSKDGLTVVAVHYHQKVN